MRALLDVNVLIALLDPDHTFHGRAHLWWKNHAKAGWASCPLTENGVVRIMSHSNYSRKLRLTPHDLVGLLARFVSGSDHEFWPDEISMRDAVLFDPSRQNSSRLVTDIYLLALAVRRGGRLATFDQDIPFAAVRSASASHLAQL